MPLLCVIIVPTNPLPSPPRMPHLLFPPRPVLPPLSTAPSLTRAPSSDDQLLLHGIPVQSFSRTHACTPARFLRRWRNALVRGPRCRRGIAPAAPLAPLDHRGARTRTHTHTNAIGGCCRRRGGTAEYGGQGLPEMQGLGDHSGFSRRFCWAVTGHNELDEVEGVKDIIGARREDLTLSPLLSPSSREASASLSCATSWKSHLFSHKSSGC